MNEPRICSQIKLEFKNEKRKSSAKNLWYVKGKRRAYKKT